MGEENTWTIYIAKNGGPHDDHDRKFTADLQEWLRDKSDRGGSPEEEAEMREAIWQMCL